MAGFTALAFGFIAAISADNVYLVVAKVNKNFFHSAQVWLTFLFFVLFFNQFIAGVLLLGLVKIVLYLKNFSNQKSKYILILFRISSLIGSVLLLIFGDYYYAISVVIFSELIDRIEFYSHLILITPQNHMYRQFQKDIKQA